MFIIVMLCAIWYHLYNLKNVKNTQGGVLLLVKLQASASHNNCSVDISSAADKTSMRPEAN